MEKKKRRRIKKPEPDSSDEDGERFMFTLFSEFLSLFEIFFKEEFKLIGVKMRDFDSWLQGMKI